MPIAIEGQEPPLCRICGVRPVIKTGSEYKGRSYWSRRCATCKGARTEEERFMEHVDKSRGCWIWRGSISSKGYGRFDSGEAHRWAYRRFNGEIEDGMFICHRCDRPACVNPQHLFAATNAENMADMVSKGRQARHEKNGQSKMTKELVVKVRALHKAGASIAELSRQFGISYTPMRYAVQRKTWIGIEDEGSA